jgi:transposase
MDVNKYSTQIERLEVVETGRRRRWSDDEKLRIVLESLRVPRAISSTARRYGISRSLLMQWHKLFCSAPDGAEAELTSFVPATVAPDPSAAPTVPAVPASGRMVIVVGKDCRVIVDAGVDAAALARVLKVLERR